MNKQGQRLYRLDGIEIDTSRFCLKREGEERHLRQQTFHVLIYLLEQRERLVTKDELINHVWRETAVTDNALEQCLAEIRKVLGDDSRNPRFIKTVPRAGYRFIGMVEEVSLNSADSVFAKVESSNAQLEVNSQTVAAGATRDQAWRSKWTVVAAAAIVMLAVTAAAIYLIQRYRSR